MADRVCWNCGSVIDPAGFEGEFTYRCQSCGELERDVRCRSCLRPLFLAASDSSFVCPHCGTKNYVRPGTLEGMKKPT